MDAGIKAGTLHHVFTKFCTKEVIPLDWQKDVTIVKLPKKGRERESESLW